MVEQGESERDSAAPENQDTGLWIIPRVLGGGFIGTVVGGLVGFATYQHDSINVSAGGLIGMPIGVAIGVLLFVLRRGFAGQR